MPDLEFATEFDRAKGVLNRRLAGLKALAAIPAGPAAAPHALAIGRG